MSEFGREDRQQTFDTDDEAQDIRFYIHVQQTPSCAIPMKADFKDEK